MQPHNLKKTIFRCWGDRQAYRKTDRQTGRQTDRQAGRQASWQASRQADRVVSHLSGKMASLAVFHASLGKIAIRPIFQNAWVFFHLPGKIASLPFSTPLGRWPFGPSSRTLGSSSTSQGSWPVWPSPTPLRKMAIRPIFQTAWVVSHLSGKLASLAVSHPLGRWPFGPSSRTFDRTRPKCCSRIHLLHGKYCKNKKHTEIVFLRLWGCILSIFWCWGGHPEAKCCSRIHFL